MILKKIVIAITKYDMLDFCKIQDKVEIIDVEVDNNIKISGEIEFMKFKPSFELLLNIDKVEDNNIYLNVLTLNILKMNLLNSLFKKLFNKIIEGFTNIGSVSFENDKLKLDVRKFINKHYDKNYIVDLTSLKVEEVVIKDNKVEVSFCDIDINQTLIIEQCFDKGLNKNHNKEEKAKSEKSVDLDEIIDVENIIDVEDDVNVEDNINLNQEIENDEVKKYEDLDLNKEKILTIEEIKKYQKNFDEDSFFEKIKKYGKTAGVSAIYGTLILYYTYTDKNVPLTAKAISLGALGYFILPTDLIPDFFVMLGYSDDIFALITSIGSVKEYINDEIRLRAENKLKEWFDNVDEAELNVINKHL